jgi:hypothetical protein
VNSGKTLFAQLMDFLPWSTFTRIVARYDGDQRVRTLSCAEHYRAMAFAQLTYRESLRDIETCLSVQASKLYSMGFREPVRRSTLADANEARDWRIYAELAQRLIVQARRLYANEDLGFDLANRGRGKRHRAVGACAAQDTAHTPKPKTAVELNGPGGHVNRDPSMAGIWWTSVSIEIFLCCPTATTAHLLMSLGQTLFHRYLGHRGIGGRFFRNPLNIHHRHYSGNHVVSECYLNEEANNTPFFLSPVTFAISLGYLVLPLNLFIVQLTAMSISFYVHLYFDKHYHVMGSWLGRFAWFRRKQQLHFLRHRYADCNFAVVDNFWDWLLGTYRSIGVDGET